MNKKCGLELMAAATSVIWPREYRRSCSRTARRGPLTARRKTSSRQGVPQRQALTPAPHLLPEYAICATLPARKVVSGAVPARPRRSPRPFIRLTQDVELTDSGERYTGTRQHAGARNQKCTRGHRD